MRRKDWSRRDSMKPSTKCWEIMQKEPFVPQETIEVLWLLILPYAASHQGKEPSMPSRLNGDRLGRLVFFNVTPALRAGLFSLSPSGTTTIGAHPSLR